MKTVPCSLFPVPCSLPPTVGKRSQRDVNMIPADKRLYSLQNDTMMDRA